MVRELRDVCSGQENPKASTREAGFTLVEVLVSLTILTLALGLLLNVFLTSSWRSRQAEQLAEAALTAQSLLARVGVDLPLLPGGKSGDVGNGQRWQLRIDRFGDAGDQRAWPAAAYKVTAEVIWTDAGQERSVALTTLRLGPKGTDR